MKAPNQGGIWRKAMKGRLKKKEKERGLRCGVYNSGREERERERERSLSL